MSEASTPAGWYSPDPADPSYERYWDGAKWTDEERAGDLPAATRPPGSSPWRMVWPVFWGAVALVLAIIAVSGGPVAMVLLALPGLGAIGLAIWTFLNAARKEASASSAAAAADLDGWLDKNLGNGPVEVITLTPSTPGPALVYPAAHTRGYDLVSETSQDSPIGKIVTATLRRRDA